MTLGFLSTSTTVGVGLVTLLVCSEAAAEIPHPDQITPGTLRGIPLHEGDPWPYAYWEYLPSDFDTVGEDHRYPMLVFLGGLGQFDDVGHCPGDAPVCWEAECDAAGAPDGLCRNLRRGPMRLIREGEWNDAQRNFLFVSPQNAVPHLSTEPWDVDRLDAFFDYMLDNYPTDPRRLYLVGMSQGGRGVLEYTAAHPRRFTAVVTSPGGAVDNDVSCRFGDTAFWAFHGEDDADGNLGVGVFDPCWMVRRVHMYNQPEEYPDFPACQERMQESYPPGRMTMFYDVEHTAWIPANDPVSVGFSTPSWTQPQDCLGIDVQYREYRSDLDPDGIYSWFADLDRPEVSVPEHLEVEADGGPVELTATVQDDDAVDFAWTQLDGPDLTLGNTDQQTVLVSGLQPEQSYTLHVRVVDGDGQWDEDEITISTMQGGATSGTPGGTGSTGTTEFSTTTGSAGSGGGMGTGSGSGTGSPATTGPVDTGEDMLPTTGSTDGAQSGSNDEDLDEGCACRASGSPDAFPLALLWLGLTGLGLRRR